MIGSAPSSQLMRRNVLLLLALLGCLFMTLLANQQNQTILSQRALIRDLFHDSMELNALKIKESQQSRR